MGAIISEAHAFVTPPAPAAILTWRHRKRLAETGPWRERGRTTATAYRPTATVNLLFASVPGWTVRSIDIAIDEFRPHWQHVSVVDSRFFFSFGGVVAAFDFYFHSDSQRFECFRLQRLEISFGEENEILLNPRSLSISRLLCLNPAYR